MKKIVLTSTERWQKILIYVPIFFMIIYGLFAIIGFMKLSAIDNNFCPILESTGIEIPDAFKQSNEDCVLNDRFVQNLDEYKKQIVVSSGMMAFVANAGTKLWNTVTKQITNSRIGTCSTLKHYCHTIIWPTEGTSSIQNSLEYVHMLLPLPIRPSFNLFENALTDDYLIMDKFGRIDIFVNLNQVDKFGADLVHGAVLLGHLRFLKFLAVLRVDLNIPDEYGITPLWRAANYGHLKIVKFFAEQGFDLHKPNYFGATLVLEAITSGSTETVKFFAEQGVDLNKPNQIGETPASEAASYGHTEILKFLEQQGVDLHQSRARPVFKGFSLLDFAALFRCTETVKYLLQKNIKVNGKIIRREGSRKKSNG